MTKKFHAYRPLSIEEDSKSRGSAPKRKYIPKPEKLRQDALNSNDGGRILCYYCGHTFGAYYVHLVRAVWPREPNHACNDCRKAKNLQRI